MGRDLRGFSRPTIYALHYQRETRSAGDTPKSAGLAIFKSMLRNYTKLLSTGSSRAFIGFEALSSIGFFAYVIAAPLIFTGAYQLDMISFSYVYTVTILVLTLSAYANSRLVRKTGILSMLKITIPTMFCAAAALMITNLLYRPTLPLFIILLSAYLAPMMMTRLNATAAAIKCFPDIAGTAAALISIIGFAVGGVSGLLVGYLHESSDTGLMAVLCVSAFLNLVLYLRSGLYLSKKAINAIKN